MSDKQLQQSFLWCIFNNDSEAWVALAMAYLQRGYELNAAYCLRQVDLTFTE